MFESERSCDPYEAVRHVLMARNELMRVDGVSPSVLVFGRLPRAPPNMAESDEDYRLLAERLHNEHPLYEVVMQRRLAARTAWIQAEVLDRTARIQSTRSRPYRGPYYKGQVVLVYRRKRGDATNPGRKGVWLGAGEVIAVEATADRFVPRIIYVTVHGRLFLCSPEQLRPISLKTAWVRQQLQANALANQTTFSEMRQVRGIDVRAERPSSAELEQEYERNEQDVVVDPLAPEADYDPLPQAPPTPAPDLPTTPRPSTPLPGTPRASPPLQDVSLSSPPALPAPVPSASDPPAKRGDKRPPDLHPAVEAMAERRSLEGPRQLPETVSVDRSAGGGR